MKTYRMSWAAAQEHKPDHPERTARREGHCLDFDITFQVWPNRASMVRTIRMQQQREPHPTDWRACVPLRETEGY
jgi:hypothetical protein